MERPSSTWQTREPRVPLYIPCIARPGLTESWLVNLSATGVGMVARVEPGAAPPREGAELDLELALPDGVELLRTKCQVAWVSGAESGSRVTLGVRFLEMSAADRGLLAQYLALYRARVGVVHASPEQEQLCRRLDHEFLLHFTRTDSELNDLLARGDVCAVLVFGQDERRALDLVEKVAHWGTQTREHVPGLSPGPCIIFCAAAAERTLLRLHNEGKLFESIGPKVQYEELFLAVQRASQDFAFRSEVKRATQQVERLQQSGGATARRTARPLLGISYGSDAMREVIELVERVAKHKIPVLLLGETGTGKELLARALHGLSDRANGPFIAQDCGALTETLLESELFGHVKGAFTGAVSDHPGLFQLANGGTIFLDEVENTPPSLQNKLLRVIETGEVRPVGGTVTRKVDVRLVAASNRDLRADAEEGRFRADLYYRLSPFPIEVPPLRERAGDVLLLACEFLATLAASKGLSFTGFTPEAEQVLMEHRWPGNVRELRNVIERAVLLAKPGGKIGVECLPRQLLAPRKGAIAPQREGMSLKEHLLQYEQELIRAALRQHNGVLARAAAELKTNAVTLGRRARQLGIWPIEGNGEEKAG